MAKQIDSIKKILADKFAVPDQNKLVEDKAPDGSDSVVMERNIKQETGIDYILYKFDPDKENIFPFFKGSTKGLKKICDYILIVEESNKMYFLLVEMKSGIDKDAKKQLDATELFAEYVLKSAERVECKIENAQIRKIRISEYKSKGKHATRPKDLEYDKNNYTEYNITGDFRIKPLLK
ncbi:hypothetical protein [Viscerimonas tarda]